MESTTSEESLPLRVDRIEAPTPAALLQSASRRLRIHVSRPMTPYEMDAAKHVHGISLIDSSQFEWEHRLLIDDEGNAVAIHQALEHIRTMGQQRQAACEATSQHLQEQARQIQQRLDHMATHEQAPAAGPREH